MDGLQKALIVVSTIAEIGGLSGFIFAGVSFLKRLGVRGTWLTGAAFAWGLGFGGAYRLAMYPTSSLLDWFLLVAFGMAGGFVATGVYKGIENASGKPK